MSSPIKTHSANSDIGRATGERLAKFRALHVLLERHRDEWTKLHPDQWVAIGAQGVEACNGDFDELLRDVGDVRILSNDLIVELLETDPARLAL